MVSVAIPNFYNLGYVEMPSQGCIVLGIESTAHTFGCGIALDDGRILANENSIYIPKEGGIHPREASRHHSAVAYKVIASALNKAGIKINDINAVAFSQGPGLGPCLRAGATVARAIALMLKKPYIPVNHCVAHIEIGRLISKCYDPLVIYVSGGNTIISAFDAGRYRIFGETLDIAYGNCIDVFSRNLNFPHPKPDELHPLDRISIEGGKFIELPYIVKGQDISYSGLLTAALKKIQEGLYWRDVAYSFYITASAMLTEVAERALALTGKKEVLLTGGNARSRLLQSMLQSICEERKTKFYVVPSEYAGDNGAMIAWTGILAYKHDITIPIEKSTIKPKWRLDEVDIPWRQ